MEMIEILKKADTLKAELDALRPISTDRMQRVMQKLRLDWNYHSNSIEGNTLSLTETRALILFGQTAKGKPFRDHLEMRGHNEALKKLEQIVHKEIKITEKLIKDFHKIILAEPYEGDSEINPGQYKKLPNYLYTPEGERMDFEPPEEVPRLMNELINWTNNQLYQDDLGRHAKRKYDTHPLLVAAIFHLRFIRIHPFGDGNGRMARILTNLILMMKGYVPAIVRTEDKVAYYRALNSSTSEDASELVIFLGEQLLRSLRIAIEGAQGKTIDEADDLDKRIEMLKRQLDQKDISTKSLSTDSIYHVIKDSLIPLFSAFEAKCEKLKDLFIDFDRKILYDEGGIQHQVGDKTSVYENLLTNWLEGNIVANHKLVRSIDYSFQLKGFKKSVAHQYMSAAVHIQFNEYTYSIRINNNYRDERVYPYDAMLLPDDIYSIIRVMIEDILHGVSTASGIHKE